MKRVILTLLLLCLLASTASALTWDIYATSQKDYLSDFSLTFNDAEGDGIVSLENLTFFSGITYDGSYLLGDLKRLPALVIGLAGGGTLTLLKTVPPGYGSPDWDDYWTVAGPEIGFHLDSPFWCYEATATTPIPGAVWLLGTGLLGLVGLRRKLRA